MSIDLTDVNDWVKVAECIDDFRTAIFYKIKNDISFVLQVDSVETHQICEPPQIHIFFTDGSSYRFYEDYLENGIVMGSRI